MVWETAKGQTGTSLYRLIQAEPIMLVLGKDAALPLSLLLTFLQRWSGTPARTPAMEQPLFSLRMGPVASSHCLSPLFSKQLLSLIHPDVFMHDHRLYAGIPAETTFICSLSGLTLFLFFSDAELSVTSHFPRAHLAQSQTVVSHEPMRVLFPELKS